MAFLYILKIVHKKFGYAFNGKLKIFIFLFIYFI